jgi:hypothetical protein
MSDTNTNMKELRNVLEVTKSFKQTIEGLDQVITQLSKALDASATIKSPSPKMVMHTIDTSDEDDDLSDNVSDVSSTLSDEYDTTTTVQASSHEINNNVALAWTYEMIHHLFFSILPHGAPTHRPASIELLYRLNACLNLKDQNDARLWAIILMSFYGMMSGASVLLAQLDQPKVDAKGQLVQCNIHTMDLGSQDSKVDYKFILPVIKCDSRICPTAALANWLMLSKIKIRQGKKIFGLKKKDSKAVKRARERLKRQLEKVGKRIGLPGEVSQVAFRYGGALCAFANHYPVERIQKYGYWPSTVWKTSNNPNERTELSASIADYVTTSVQRCQRNRKHKA